MSGTPLRQRMIEDMTIRYLRFREGRLSPVMTAGVGLPLIVHRFGGNPVPMAALGMLSGFCGTLMTPMAANYNIVPVALLELPDRWAVIKAQAPTGVLLLAVNILVMTYVVF